ncbi:40S ribosomal protein S12 [Capsicum chinense]|nr:40S ribosomal protein S12 [Capsicum chinense]
MTLERMNALSLKDLIIPSLGLIQSKDDVVVAVAETPAPALEEPMDIMTALQLMLRKSRANGGLFRELNEGAKVIENHAAQLCVLSKGL